MYQPIFERLSLEFRESLCRSSRLDATAELKFTRVKLSKALKSSFLRCKHHPVRETGFSAATHQPTRAGLGRHPSGGCSQQRVLCVSRGEGRPEGRAFQIGYSGHEWRSLRLVPSLRPLTSDLRSPTQPPPSGRCRFRRQRLPASPDWRRPRAKRKP